VRYLLSAAICITTLWNAKPVTTAVIKFNTVSDTSVPENGTGLFENDSLFEFRLSGNIRDLFADRSDDAIYHPLILTYQKNDTVISIDLKAKTRGNFRRDKVNCTYPPVLLNFQRKVAKPSLFQNMDKLKLVCPCKSETYIVREYLVYRLYNLLSPQSFRARLVRVTFDDVPRKRELTMMGILLEEDEQMAKRNQTVLVHTKNLHGQNIESTSFLRMAMFQYMIGNTDWSTEYFHNTRMIARDSLSMPSVVPYDFDHAGIVNTPYAHPADELGLSSTRERRYRGYCLTDLKRLDVQIADFNRLKNDFYNVYYKCTFLDSKYVSSTIQFLDQFYGTINNPEKVKSEFGYPCKKGVPNIIIKGIGK
jgi:hypothetical protein